MINWLSMLAADQVVFNSAFHRDSWFGALPNFLKNFPDMPHTSLISPVREKCQVLPVGVDLARLDAARPQPDTVGEPGAPPLILWNQRWEYDKNPGAFFRALRALVARDVPFRVALAGANFRQEPEEFEASQAWLGDRLVHYGRAGRARYHRLLWDADIVVSTAIHEFFGIAIVEAIYCETFPVLPRRLAYPELLPEAIHARCLYQDSDELVETLAWALQHADDAHAVAARIRPTAARFDWREVAPRYDALLAEATRAFSR
jgi:glycosyltransferase involved in cell wall biosynthesis